jgi:hypothetical protein
MAAGDADDLRRRLDAWGDAGFGQVSFSGVLGPDPELALQMLGDELARRQHPEPPPVPADDRAGERQ